MASVHGSFAGASSSPSSGQGRHSMACAKDRGSAARAGACSGLDSRSAYRSERMSTHVVPSGALTAMSTTISSALPGCRRISTEPCGSVRAVDSRTLSTAAGTMSRGLEPSTKRATWTAASSSATVDASVKPTSATRPPGVGRSASIDQANG